MPLPANRALVPFRPFSLTCQKHEPNSNGEFPNAAFRTYASLEQCMTELRDLLDEFFPSWCEKDERGTFGIRDWDEYTFWVYVNGELRLKLKQAWHYEEEAGPWAWCWWVLGTEIEIDLNPGPLFPYFLQAP